MRRVESELRMDGAWPLRGVIASHLATNTSTAAPTMTTGTVLPTASTESSAPATTTTTTAATEQIPACRGTDTVGNESEKIHDTHDDVGVPSAHASSAPFSASAGPADPADPLVNTVSKPEAGPSPPSMPPPRAGVAQQPRMSLNNTVSTVINTHTTSSSGAGARSPVAPGSPSANADERVFEEILDAEVAVSITKLREAARSLGVPHSLRATVYRYLLGVASMDKSSEMTSERMQEKDVEMLSSGFLRLWGQDIVSTTTGRFRSDDGSREDAGKTGARRPGGTETDRGTFMRYYGLSLWPTGSDSGSLIRADESPWANATRLTSSGTVDAFSGWSHEVESVLRMEPFRRHSARHEKMEMAMTVLYMTHPDLSPEEIHYLVGLAIPFEGVCSTSRDIFFCTYTVFAVQKMFGNVLQDDACLQRHCGQFLMLLRDTNATLYNHLYAQGVSTWEWVPSLLIMLFADRHMHPSDLLRLWDAYIADVWEYVGFPLHPFICLAVLSELTEELVECEREEILFRIQHFPRLHIPGIIQRALATRESVISRGVL